MAERKIIDLAARKKERAGQIQTQDEGVEIPDFITPHDIVNMSDDQLEQLLNLIRLRRMSSVMIYEQTVAEKERHERSRTIEQIEKKANQVFNELERAFKVLDKLELRVNELRALRLQIGMEF